MTKVTACLNCVERHPCCHDSCARYQAEKAKMEEEKRAVWETRDIDTLLRGYSKGKSQRLRKYRKDG